MRIPLVFLGAAAHLQFGGVGASAAGAGAWLVVPLLLDFQPVLLPIDTSQGLTEQLEWFCGVHGLERARCAGSISSGIAQVADVGSRCRHSEASGQLPGFLMLRNTFPVSAPTPSRRLGNPVAKWRQDEAGNIAKDLCRFTREYGDAEDLTVEECASSLGDSLAASFDWMLALELCSSQMPLQERDVEGLTRRDGAVALNEQLHVEIGSSDSRERNAVPFDALLATANGAIDDEEDASNIKRESTVVFPVHAQPSNQVVPSKTFEEKPSRHPSKSTERGKKLARSFFNELRSLPMATATHYSVDLEHPQWLLALAMLMTVYCFVGMATLYLRKSMENKGAQRYVGTMDGLFVRGGDRRVIKADIESLEGDDSSGEVNISKNDSTSPSGSETCLPEVADIDGNPVGGLPGAATSPGTPLPFPQLASSSTRRTRAWSSPCLVPGLHFQSSSRNTGYRSLLRGLSRDDGDSHGSVNRHPSFTRAAIAVMMTRPCAVLPPKRVITGEANSLVGPPSPLLSPLVEDEDSVRRSHQLMAALRLQRIWRSRSGEESDKGGQQLIAPMSDKPLAAMESIAKTIATDDFIQLSAGSARPQACFATRVPSDLPKFQ